MSTPILATKLFVPRPRPSLVHRARLIEQLNDGLHRRLTLISAPAGFGKTTLVSEWIAGLDDSTGRAAAWLSLEVEDSDPTRFLNYLVAALQTASPDLGEGVLQALQSPQPPPAEEILATLVNEIATVADELLLVLDDYHVIDTKSVDDTVAFLLEHLPPQMHLAIATREDPQLPLSRLRARGQLTELRAADLRFTAAEAVSFFKQVMSLELSTEEISALESRTEGWIAGLQLAALSMQGRDDIAGFVQAFAGDNRYIVDYLVDEVLECQPESVRAFLLQSSILDRMNGPLCDAVGFGTAGSVDDSIGGTDTENEISQAILENLEHANLFVVPLDDSRRWFRYHHLFADVLRTRLAVELPELIPVLHRRASEWYEQNGQRADAVRHALLSEDYKWAATLIELAWPEMDGTFQPSIWLEWKRALPDEVSRNRPVLEAAHAWALLDVGEMEAGEARLRELEELLKAPTDELTVVDEEQFRSLPASMATARCYNAQVLGDLSGTVQHGRRALDLLPREDHLRRGPPAALMSLAYWANGELEAAAQTMADAMTEFELAGNEVFAISGTFGLADIRLAQGRLREAERTYERSHQLAVQDGKPLLRGSAYLYLGLGELQYEKGDMDSAMRLLRKSEEVREQPPMINFQYRFHLVEARIKESLGEFDDVLELLDKAASSYVRTPLPDVRPIAALKARVWIAQGKVDEALDWARIQGLSADDELSYLHEFEHMTLARALMAEYERHGVDQAILDALRLLERLLHAAEQNDRLGSALEARILQALAYRLQGDIRAALATLAYALTLAEPEGYVRTFVDQSTPMAELLALINTDEVRTRQYVDRLIAAFEGQTTVRTSRPVQQVPVPQTLVEPLSDREIEVLRLVAEGLTNREIGDRLFLALDTVKGHNRRIFGKLQVQRRTEAVARARELGLL